MKVKELLEKLQQYDPELDVFLAVNDEYCTELTGINIDETYLNGTFLYLSDEYSKY